MEINTVGAYSADKIYGFLTSPFVPKTITVNSNTPFDQADEENIMPEVFSRKDFEGKPYPKIKFDIGNDENKKTSPLTVKTKRNEQSNALQFNNQDEEKNNLANKLEISSFSISKLSSKDIVNSSLKLGYSADEAVIIDNARKAYEKSLLITDNPAETLSNCSYTVK